MSLTSSERMLSILRLISMRNVYIQTKPYINPPKGQIRYCYTALYGRCFFHPKKA